MLILILILIKKRAGIRELMIITEMILFKNVDIDITKLESLDGKEFIKSL